jgi:hypothetical protein
MGPTCAVLGGRSSVVGGDLVPDSDETTDSFLTRRRTRSEAKAPINQVLSSVPIGAHSVYDVRVDGNPTREL